MKSEIRRLFVTLPFQLVSYQEIFPCNNALQATWHTADRVDAIFPLL